jgi:hypothetical protein
MAVTTVTTTMAAGVNYTRVTDTSADWASVPNSTYFYDKADKLVHYKDGSGTVLEIFAAGGGGLTEFTELETTAAPNATVPVNSLTPVTATTNADFALRPKGNGALLGLIPDNAGTGGNKRGQYAVDLQLSTDFSTRVASGNYSAIIGGQANTASGTHSLASGTYSVASGTYSVALGYYSVASGDNYSTAIGNGTASGTFGSVAIGRANTASGTGAVAISGYGCVSSGTRSVAMGESCTASGDNSVAIGFETIANAAYSNAQGYKSHTFGIIGRQVYASGQEGTAGDSQASKFILRERTTNDTATTLTTNSAGTGFTNNQIFLSNQSAYRFKGTIVGKQSGSVNAAVWDVDGFIVRGANAAATTLNISNVTLVQNTPAWGTPTLAADTTNGGLQVQVTGAAATNIQWTAVIETTEVIYA